MALGRALLCAAAATLLASTAQAVPSTFTFVSGEVHITAQRVGDVSFLVDETVALDGTYIDFEVSPVGVPDFEISIAPSGSIMMSGSYAGYDTFVIESAVLTPGSGFSSSGVDLGSGQYSVTMGPVDVDAVYSASDSTLTNPPSGSVPISFTNPSLSATVNSNLVTFEMMGITLGIIPALPGETAPLIVKGDITFVGVIPEPATGTLVGLGLLGLGLGRAGSLRNSASDC